jgi:hypothetical protein
MAAKGTESKGIIFDKLKEVYPESFWEDEGKILRIPMNENGNIVEIKVTLTAAKNILGSGETPSAFAATAVSANAAKPVVEMTQEEKDAVNKALASLGF